MKERNPYFDNLKVSLILLVILGHILPIDLKDKINLATYELIFSFHMPLFVFISGYFTRLTHQTKFWKRIMMFLETYITFSIIHIIISFLQGQSLSILQILTIPRWTLWYLLSLVLWRIMLYLTPSSIRNSPLRLIVLSIILCLGMGFIPINSNFSFQRTFSFLPYFIAGYVIANTKMPQWRIPNIKLLSLMVIIILWVILFIIPMPFTTYLHQKTCYYQGSHSPIFYLFVRGGWLIFASLVSLCFLCIIPKKDFRWTHFGSLTLFIYLYHSVILSWRYILRDDLGLPTNLLFCVIYSAIVMIIIWLCSKVKIFHWLLNPIHQLTNKSSNK